MKDDDNIDNSIEEWSKTCKSQSKVNFVNKVLVRQLKNIDKTFKSVSSDAKKHHDDFHKSKKSDSHKKNLHKNIKGTTKKWEKCDQKFTKHVIDEHENFKKDGIHTEDHLHGKARNVLTVVHLALKERWDFEQLLVRDNISDFTNFLDELFEHAVAGICGKDYVSQLFGRAYNRDLAYEYEELLEKGKKVESGSS